MYRLAAEAPLSAVAIPTILYFTLLIVTVEPTLYFFFLAYAESATSTLALVSDALKVRPLVIFEEVSGPIADSVTSVPYTVYELTSKFAPPPLTSPCGCSPPPRPPPLPLPLPWFCWNWPRVNWPLIFTTLRLSP